MCTSGVFAHMFIPTAKLIRNVSVRLVHINLQRSLSKGIMYRCYLMCVQDTHDQIELHHGKPVVLGRCEETKILDKRCSRKQVEFTSDCIKRLVAVKQLGNNPCSIDGDDTKQDVVATIKEGNTFEFLSGFYPHKIKFVKREAVGGNKREAPVPTKESKHNITDYFSNKTQKRKTEDMDAGQSSIKKAKLSTSDKKELKGVDLSDTSSTSTNRNITHNRGNPIEKASWNQHDHLLIYNSEGVQASSLIASFDMDGTIITTESGKVFPTHIGDWRMLFPEVKGKLRKLHDEGYKIVFFTNQLGIQRGKLKVEDFKGKVAKILTRLNLPVQVFVSTGAGIYRKPCTGMWDYMKDNENDGISIDMANSFYVGDGAGRPVNWIPKRKKDFSCSDRLFAINLGLNFHTPEEYFLAGKKAPFNMPVFDPKNLSTQLLDPPDAKLVSEGQEVIIVVGFPASGKSFFTKEYLVSKGYFHVNRDTMKTWQKCVDNCKQALAQGKKVVIDNTNPDLESRQRYISCAKKAGVPCRCFVFTATIEQARHTETFREITDTSHEKISDMVMNMYRSKYVEPKLAEGFTEIVKVNFVPKFKNKTEENLYRQYLKEK